MAILRLGEVDMMARIGERPDGEERQTHFATRADAADLRAEVAKSGARTARWIVASVSVGVAVMTIMYGLVG